MASAGHRAVGYRAGLSNNLEVGGQPDIVYENDLFDTNTGLQAGIPLVQ